jgi:hypothetical protein
MNSEIFVGFDEIQGESASKVPVWPAIPFRIQPPSGVVGRGYLGGRYIMQITNTADRLDCGPATGQRNNSSWCIWVETMGMRFRTLNL